MSDSLNIYLAQRSLAFAESVGVRHFVICAGARNAPWIQLLTHFQEEREWTLWNHFDERSAAFFALGLAKRTGQPAAVLTTSGTAAAELLPAVVEAYHSAIPLIVMTADRPFHFRESGAPQAIMQEDLYRYFINCSVNAECRSHIDRFMDCYGWDRRSPLHMNIGFEEPEPFEFDQSEPWEMADLRPRAEFFYKYSPQKWRHFWKTLLLPDSLGAIVLGALPDSWKGPVVEWMRKLPSGVLVWADATCGIREDLQSSGLTLVRGETDWLQDGLTHCLRIGEVPSCRGWRDLEKECWKHLRVGSISPTPFPGLARETLLWCPDRFDLPDHPWEEMRFAEGPLQTIPQLLDEHPASEPAAVRWLSRQIGADDLVFLGNSMPIREWNLAAELAGEPAAIFASRGANGIDGQIATWLGLTAVSDELASWAILGDLTALYDLNGLWMSEQLAALVQADQKLRLVVLNNAGGRIFSRLPALSSLPKPAYDLAENRHSTSFRDHAAAWGWGYHLVQADHLGDRLPDQVLQQPRVIIEVSLSQAHSEDFWRDLKARSQS